MRIVEFFNECRTFWFLIAGGRKDGKLQLCHIRKLASWLNVELMVMVNTEVILLDFLFIVFFECEFYSNLGRQLSKLIVCIFYE